MLPVSLPRSVTGLLDRFRGCFTAPTFTTFCGLACGFWAQPGLHTVTGMLIGARLEQAWHHARAHRFFSGARWSADQLGLVLLDLILAVLVPSGVPVRLVADDTLMRRSGRKVFGTGWHHDPLAPGRHRIAWANNWVVLGVLVDLPFIPHRPVCLPILARLWQPKHTPGRLDLAVELVKLACGHLGQRRVDLLVDGAYAGRQLRGLPRQVTVTCRLRADARLHRLAPPRRLGTRGRPRTKGDRLPELTTIAGLQATPFALHQVTCYGHNGIAAIAGFACLWPAVFATRPVQVVLVRDPAAPDSFDLALVSTDLSATPAALVERYAGRWQVEVCFREARQDAGVGQARNRTRRAVERTVPFGLVCYSLAIVWYTQHGHHPADLAARRALAPWYQSKATPSVADMLAKLRRVLIAAQYRHGQAIAPTTPEILEVQAAWATAGP
jgi:DDE superfamily endonuclease